MAEARVDQVVPTSGLSSSTLLIAAGLAIGGCRECGGAETLQGAAADFSSQCKRASQIAADEVIDCHH